MSRPREEPSVAAASVVLLPVQSEADRVAVAVLACPAVVRLSGGRGGEVATYLPGRQVVGVRLTDAGAVVHVVGAYGPTCTVIGEQVRAAVRSVLGPRPVAVGIDDLELDPLAPR